jgi:hypothetical protein
VKGGQIADFISRESSVEEGADDLRELRPAPQAVLFQEGPDGGGWRG